MTKIPSPDQPASPQTTTDALDDGEALGRMIDLCVQAQRLAERSQEHFIVYLLAMTIQECRSRLPGGVSPARSTD